MVVAAIRDGSLRAARADIRRARMSAKISVSGHSRRGALSKVGEGSARGVSSAVRSLNRSAKQGWSVQLACNTSQVTLRRSGAGQSIAAARLGAQRRGGEEVRQWNAACHPLGTAEDGRLKPG